MRRGFFFTFLILTTGIVSFAQQKSFGTKTIGQWTFEKFPLHYSVTPAKALSNRNAFTGKLEGYQELNQFGQAAGLTLTMRADGIYPSSAIYTFKGEMVYEVSFFPASKIAQSITTYNKDGELDGYRIYRELKSTGGYTEESDKYDNGVLIAVNGVKQAPVSAMYKDSLLNGKFKFEQNSAGFVIEGEAENGKLKRIKQAYDGKYSIREITFSKDSFRVKVPSQSTEGQFSYESYPLLSNPTLTNSKSLCDKHNNYNYLYPYLFIPDLMDIRKLEDILNIHHSEPVEQK